METKLTNGPAPKKIREVAKHSGLILSDNEVSELTTRKAVALSETNFRPVGHCPGIQIADIGNGWVLYLNPFSIPPTVMACHEK